MTSKKLPEFGIKAPKQITTSEVSNAQIMSSFAKWVPLICAGAAVGVSVLALKEIKNVRKELINFKKETVTPLGGGGVQQQNNELTEKIERMDEQLRKITQYLANQNNKPKDLYEYISHKKPDLEEVEDIYTLK